MLNFNVSDLIENNITYKCCIQIDGLYLIKLSMLLIWLAWWIYFENDDMTEWLIFFW